MLFEPEGNTECWLVRSSVVGGIVGLCFGLEITDHIHDPVQIKGSVKKKKKKKRRRREYLTPRLKKGRIQSKKCDLPLWSGWSEGGRKKCLNFSQGKKKKTF